MVEAYMDLKKIKERLELHVASEMQTLLMGIHAIQEVKEDSREAVVQGTLDLINILVAPEKFSIYWIYENELRQIANQGWEENDVYIKNYLPTSLLFQEVIENKRVASILTSGVELLGEEGVLAVPIFSEKSHQVIGMIKIEKIPFVRLKTAMVESMRIIAKWFGEAYERVSPQ